MWEAWQRGEGYYLSAFELDELFTMDDAMRMAATQELAGAPWEEEAEKSKPVRTPRDEIA
jgi:hypothetical protein